MAEWTIKTSDQKTEEEQRLRDRYGDEEYEDRVFVAQSKTEELERRGQWEAAMFYATHFEMMALGCDSTILAKARELSASKWMVWFHMVAGK